MTDREHESIEFMVGQMMAKLAEVERKDDEMHQRIDEALDGIRQIRTASKMALWLCGGLGAVLTFAVSFGVWIVQTNYAQDAQLAVIETRASAFEEHEHPAIERAVQQIASDVRSVREARDRDSDQLDRMQASIERIARRR